MAIDTSSPQNGTGTTAPTREKPSGRSGTVNTRGFIQDREFNSALRWPLNLDEYDKMRRTDPTVRWMLALLSTPIRAALWDIEPPENPSPEEMEATCFAKHAIFHELDGGWDEHLRQALTFFDFGHSVFERVADLRTVEFDVDPQEVGDDPRHVKRDAIVLAQLGPRLQRTIQRWIVDEREPNRLVKVIQWLADGHDPSVAEIDADRLLIYVNEKEGDDWRGDSVLRSAWKSWFTKSELQNIEAIAFERTAGLPVVYPPAEAGAEDIDAVEEAVSKMRQGENVYLIMPGPKQLPARGGVQPGNEWLVEDLSVDAAAGMSAEFGSAIGRYDTEMARNVMASFMQLGMQEVGARATADIQQDPYYQAIEAQVSYIEDTFTEGVIRPLLDWNYTLERYPRLTASKIQAKNVQVIAEAIAALVKNGAIQPDEPMEDYLRELLDAPERDPDYEEEEEGDEIEAPEGEPRGGSRGEGAGNRGSGGPQKGAGGTSEPGEGSSPGMAASTRRPRFLRRRRRRGKGQREAFAQFIPPRPLRGPEKHVAWAQVQGTLDNAGLDIIAIAERVMGGQIDSVSSSADEAVEAADLEAIEALRLDPRPLSEALEDELLRIYSTGAADVRAEIRRQADERRQEGLALPEAMAQEGEPPNIPLSRTETAAIIAALAKQLAESGSEAAARAIKQRALKTLAQRAKTPDVPGENPLAELRAALRKQAPLAANRIYSLGRMDEIKAQKSRGMIEVVVRSAILDAATCEVCEAEDGSTFRPEVAPPLPDAYCDGGDRCRCVYIADLGYAGDTTLP